MPAAFGELKNCVASVFASSSEGLSSSDEIEMPKKDSGCNSKETAEMCGPLHTFE